jgi:carbon storage regulator
MLILQRKAGQSVLIGDDINVTVVSVDGSRVRLAITAPKDTSILRSELVVATAANRDAAKEEAPPSELLRLLDGVLPRKDAKVPRKGDKSP